MSARQLLLLRADGALCAMPLANTIEILRPPPLEVLPDASAFVAGLTIARGAPIVVLSLRGLLGAAPGQPGRLVILRISGRRAGLLVDNVVGIRTLDDGLFGPLPSLMSRSTAATEAIGSLDGELLRILDAAHLVTEDVLALAQVQRAAS